MYVSGNFRVRPVGFCCYRVSPFSYQYNVFMWLQSPSTLLEEKQYNVFLRTSVAAVQEAVGLMNTEQADLRPHVLAALRARKDKFKYKL